MVEAANRVSAGKGEEYSWRVTFSNSGRLSWPAETRLYLLNSGTSWPLAELAPGETLTKVITLRAEGFRLVEMRAGVAGVLFGAKLCHEVVERQPQALPPSGILCAETTWRKQRP